MGFLASILPPVVSGLIRRSLENPRRPLDPWDQALGETIDGSLSVAGVRVSREKALTFSAVWRAVSLISRTVAKLPLGAYRNAHPNRERDADHEADWLLRCQPNDAMTPFVYKQLVVNHVLLEGNHYSYIDRLASSRPVALLPLDPRRTYPVREGKRLWYVHELKGGELRRLDPADVFHVKGLGYDGLTGYNVLSRARDSFGGAIANQAYGGVFYRNAARPNVALKHPGRLSPEARRNLRESWERMHQGLDNAHRTAILEEGLEVVLLTVNAKDAQMIESKQFSLIDVANWFNLPPHKLGANISTSYGSLEQENRNFLDDAIDPWLVAIEEECEAKLLSSYQRNRGTHAIAFDRYPLVQADMQQRGDFYNKAIQSGWMSPDEARGREGMNPMAGGIGKVYFFPLNMARVGGDPDGDGPAVAPGAKLLKVPDVRQEAPFACGAAVVRSVCDYFGRGARAEAEVIELLGTNKREGTTPAAILGYLSRIGLATVAASEMEVSDLTRRFAEGMPVLCPVQADAPSGTQGGHWVIVIGTGLGHVFVQDPDSAEGGRRMIPEEEWLSRWHDRDAEGNAYKQYGIAVAEEIPEPPAVQQPETQPDPKPAEADQGGADEAARRGLLCDVLKRMVKRLGTHARRAAGEPRKFGRWLDSIEADHRSVMTEAFAPVAAVLGLGRADHLADMLASEVRAGMLAASECQSSELAAKVDEWFSTREATPSSLDTFGVFWEE